MFSLDILALLSLVSAVQVYADDGEQTATSHQEVDTGPRLYYHESTLTWDTSEGFCKQFEHRNLCSFDDLCPMKNGARQFIHDVIPGDHWVATKGRGWVEIGDWHSKSCFLHGNPPTWGDIYDPKPWKGYVYCCKDTSPDTAPAIAYRFIGGSATYDMSRDHCRHQGRRLCYSSEVCVKNKPVYGVVRNDEWIAVEDRYNEWIQIGTSGHPTCGHHGPKYGLPGWGTRTDGSHKNFLGFVYCCK